MKPQVTWSKELDHVTVKTERKERGRGRGGWKERKIKRAIVCDVFFFILAMRFILRGCL